MMDERRIIIENRKNGFTLIELIVVLAITGVILSILFSINLSGIKIFNKGEDRSDNQYEVRMASDFIVKQLRYAKSIEIINSEPSLTSGKNYIYLKQTGSKSEIIYDKNGVSANIPGANNITDFTLSFKKIANNIINLTIGKSGTTSYDLLTDVNILNITALSPYSIQGNEGIGIIYTLDETIPDSEAVSLDLSWLNISNPNNITDNISLPTEGPHGTSISWSSNNTSIVSNDGEVTRPTTDDATVILNATITKGSQSSTKIFTLTVIKGSSLTIASIDDVQDTIKKDETYIMPQTVLANMSDNSKMNVPITWNPNYIDTSKKGTKTSTGTVINYSKKITLTVNVTNK